MGFGYPEAIPRDGNIGCNNDGYLWIWYGHMGYGKDIWNGKGNGAFLLYIISPFDLLLEIACDEHIGSR